MKKNYKTKKQTTINRSILLTWNYQFFSTLFLILCLTPVYIFAEGTSSIAPSPKDEAAIYIGAGDTGAGGGDYGLFGWKDSNSRLFFNIQNTCEKVYMGFSVPKNNRAYNNFNPNTGGLGTVESLIFRVIAPNGQPINDLDCFGDVTINGEVWQTLNSNTVNLTSRAETDRGPSQLVADGYDGFELDLSACGLTFTGDYAIEFFTTDGNYNPNRANSGFHVEFFDITVANCDNQGQTGRVWSNNWSLSIKADGEGSFDRAFNGAFYVCSDEGFITKIDFNSLTNNRALAGRNTDQLSGFRAGSFNVSFNTTGPNNSGDILTDRLSLGGVNSPNPELAVFLNLPDEIICPEQPIGQFQQMKNFVTGCNDSRCINMATTQKGQIDIILEKGNGNGIFDQPEEVRISYDIEDSDKVTNPETPGFEYQICLPWNGKDALDNTWDINDLKISGFFRQGVYHFPSYDAEFNDDGFLVETVRPALGVQQIYYDDQMIAEENNTGESKDGSNGCVAPCHRWTGEWEDFTNKDDVYGNFNTINTWWFGNTEFKEFTVAELNPLSITCPPDYSGCFGDPILPLFTGFPLESTISSDCIQITYSDVTEPAADCAGGQLITRTWVTFLEGMESETVECVQLIKLAGTTPPEFSTTPNDITISCDEPLPSVEEITAVSACENKTTTVTFSETEIIDSCPNTTLVSRVWSATDDCGNTRIMVQVITIQDTKGPTFLAALDDINLNCDAPAPTAADLSLSDNCDAPEDISIIFSDRLITGEESCSGGQTLVRTYIATDRCGNSSRAEQRIIFQDNTPPMLTNVPPNTTVSCDGLSGLPNVVSATDNCDVAANIQIILAEEFSTGDCGGNQILKRIWTATDGCGNVATAEQLIAIEDNSSPILVGIPADITASCDDVPAASSMVSAQDNCSDVTIRFSEQATAGLCAGSSVLKRTWTATDACGNASTGTQTVTILDTTPPTFVDCSQKIKATAGPDCQAMNVPITPPTAMDNCSNEVTITSSHDLNVPFQIGLTSIIFTATDACGNSATCEYLIQVDNGPFDDCPEDIIVDCNPMIDAAVITWEPPNGNDCCSSCSDETEIDGYIYLGLRGGHRYYLSEGVMDWDAAVKAGEDLGGGLATINDPAENAFLDDMIDLDESAFIGLSDVGSEGSFYWLDGTPVTYTNWMNSQPNNYNDLQHYGQFVGNGEWNDAYSTKELRALVEIVCVDVQQVEGPLNGSEFEAGVTKVAYTIDYDECNNADYCEFLVTVGDCPLRYCKSAGSDATCFWIDRIQLADLDHSSGADGGYADNTSMTANLTQGKTETMLLKPGFNNGHMYDLQWSVFIDYNQDGDFEDEDELVIVNFEKRLLYQLGDGPVFQDFTVPVSAKTGPTRMRVAMKFTEDVDPCDRFVFGEVQDYTINIHPVNNNLRQQIGDIELFDLSESVEEETTVSVLPNFGLTPNKTTSTIKLALYPNPVHEMLTVVINNKHTIAKDKNQLKIYNRIGQVVYKEVLSGEANQTLQVDVRMFVNGFYLLEVVDGEGNVSQEKFTKL